MTTDRHMAHLESSGLLRLAQTQPELEYIFRHALVQDAAYESLLIADRKRLHLTVGESLERLYPDQLDEVAPLLGHHFALAGDEQKALKYFILAGDVDFGLYANAEAVEHYTHAVELAQHSQLDDNQFQHLYSRRGRALELDVKYDEALANYAGMETLARERGHQPIELAALMAQATIRTTSNPALDPSQGATLLKKARMLAQDLGDQAAEAKILWNLLLLGVTTGGDPHQMIDFGEQSLALARQLNLSEQIAFTLHDLWYAYACAGQWLQAKTVLEEAHDLWRTLDHLPVFAESLTRTYYTYLLLGDYDQAAVYFEEALAVSKASNSPEAQAISISMIGLAYFDQGQPTEALSLLEKAGQLGEAVGNPLSMVGSRSELAWVYGQLGDVERGLALAQKMRKTADDKFTFIRGWPLVVLARLHLRRGNLAAAERVMAEVGDYRHLKDTLGFIPFIWIGAALAKGELTLAKGDYDRTATVMSDLLVALQETNLRYLLADALYLKSQALLDQGQIDVAHATLLQARTEAEAVGSQRILWQILIKLAEIESDSIAAKALRQQARLIVEAILNRMPTPDLQLSFRNLLQVQGLLRPRRPH